MRRRKIRAWMFKQYWDMDISIPEMIRHARMEVSQYVESNFIASTLVRYHDGRPVYSGIELLHDAISENRPNRIVDGGAVYR